MPFVDRADAGRQLAAALAGYKDRRPIVLALPRGGVPVAAEVVSVLDAPLDLILVRKIGVPYQPELAMGAVVDGRDPLVVENTDVVRAGGITAAAFAEVRDRELAEIGRRRTRYLGGRAHPRLEGRTVIVIDDGVATGATTRAALRSVRRRKPEWLVLAVPVAPTETLDALAEEADEIVCLEDYESFMAIGVYYSDFNQISDEEVTETLARFPAERSTPERTSPP